MKPVILAGGKGERIGGKKPLKLLLGKPLIYWVFNKAKLIDIPVYISVKNREQEEEIKTVLLKENIKPTEFIFIKDLYPNLEGPISGIFSALKIIQDNEPLLILAVDQPFIDLENIYYFKTLSEIFCHNFLIVTKGEEKIRPFPGIYPLSLKSEIEIFINTFTKRSLFRFFNYLKEKNLVLFIINVKIKNKSFININTWEDLKKAEKCFYQSLKTQKMLKF